MKNRLRKRVKNADTARSIRNSSTTSINTQMRYAPKEGEAVFNLHTPLSVTNTDDGKGLKKLSFVGYSGAPVDLSDYGLEHPMIYNIEGISYKNSVPILYEHWTPVGHTTTITKNSDSLQGEGVASYPSEARDTVVQALDNGFPFEGSMGLRIMNEDHITFIEKGESRSINNRTVKGPMYVAEHSVLHEMTVTMSGRDSDTQFQLLNQEAITMLKNSKPRVIKNSDPAPAAPVVPPAAPAPVVPPVVENAAPSAVPPAAPVPPGPSRKEFAQLSRLMAKYAEHADFISTEYEEGKSLGDIENSIKVKQFENGLPTVPNLTPQERQGEEAAILANFALAVGVKAETLEKHGINKKILDNAVNGPRWGFVETLLNIANAQERTRRFTGFSDLDVMCNSIKLNNRQTFLNASFSTIDMPNILRKVTTMQLEERWEINPPFAAKYLKEESNKDFRTTQRFRPSGGQIWDEMKLDGKIEQTQFGKETEYRSSLSTSAQLVVWNRQDVINDDMGVIADMLDAMVEGALIVPDMKLGKLMLVKAAAANSYWINTDNSFTSTALNRTTLSARYNAVRQYNENRGKNFVNLINDRWTLITSITGEEIAWDLVKQDRIVNDTTANTKTGDKNYWFNKFDLAVFPQMSNTSLLNNGAASTFVSEGTWLLWPSSQRYSPYTITYLRGLRRPTIETVELPENMLGFGVRGYWDVEINEREREAIVRCNG